MTRNLKRAALVAALAAGAVGFGQQATAGIIGKAGEALLVPLAVWGDPGVNTIIEIEVPGSIGWEDVANIYTAPHVTPTNPGITEFPPFEALESEDDLTIIPASAQINWYWFDKTSKKQKSGFEPVTPDDVVQWNVRDLLQGSFKNAPGYLLVTTRSGALGRDADFAMFGHAYLVSGALGAAATIPVLPLADGADTIGVGPTADNNVVTAGLTDYKVSPLISGYRNSLTLNPPGGVLTDYWLFDLMLSGPGNPTLHVVWLDQNRAGPTAPSNAGGVQVYVFDTHEIWCDDKIPLPYELNLIWVRQNDPNSCSGAVCDDQLMSMEVSDDYFAKWVTYVKPDLCYPTGAGYAYKGKGWKGSNIGTGFVRYQMYEYQDESSGTPESSGLPFAIKFAPVNGNVFAEMAMGHDLGMFTGK